MCEINDRVLLTSKSTVTLAAAALSGLVKWSHCFYTVTRLRFEQ